MRCAQNDIGCHSDERSEEESYNQDERREQLKKAKRIIILDIILTLLVIAAATFIFLRAEHKNNAGETESPDTSNVTESIEERVEEPAETESDAEKELRLAELNEWYLLLVNNDKAIPDDFTVETAETESGYEVDARVKEPLENMLAGCREAGYSPQIISAFRSHETQQYLYDTTANKNDTAIPGHSEHECGLAIDIIDTASSGWADPLIDEQEDLPAQKWLMENCQNYGFILRYPKDKEDITQIIYEPWHYRYVGVEHAKKIMEEGICLEEHIESLS